MPGAPDDPPGLPAPARSPEAPGGPGSAPDGTDRRTSRALLPARLVDDAPHRRKLTIAALVPDRPDAVFALRTVLLRDGDASIRARAAERLRALDPAALDACGDAVGDALAEALGDGSSLVREAAARAAGALRSRRAEVALREALRSDPTWQVRRSAARALARCAMGGRGVQEVREGVAALLEALDDPFWRVRYAAIQALADLPEALLAAGEAPPVWTAASPAPPAAQAVSPPGARSSQDSLNTPQGPAPSPRRAAALAYLEAVRRGELGAAVAPPEPELVDADPPEASSGDPDPAVTAARIAAGRAEAKETALLLASLASPHAALRRAAVRALAARGRVEEIAAALRWLDEPRVLYAAGAARRLLLRAGSLDLVKHVLGDERAGPGARAWALAEAARIDPGIAGNAARTWASRAEEEPRVRRAALAVLARLGDDAAITSALVDPDETTRAEAAAALAPLLDDPAVRGALDPLAAAVAVASPPGGHFVARALLEIARRWIGKDPGAESSAWLEALLKRASAAPWADVRAEAVALRSLEAAAAGRRTSRHEARPRGDGRTDSGDPRDGRSADHGAAPDNSHAVHGAAPDNSHADHGAAPARGVLDPAEREAFLGDPDPWVREAAMDAVHGARALADDPDPFVRRAAARAALVPPGRSRDTFDVASRAALAARKRGGFGAEPQVTEESAVRAKRAAQAAAEVRQDFWRAALGPLREGQRGAPLRATRRAVPSPPPREPHAAATLAARSDDAWIRALAAEVLDARAHAGLVLLLGLTRDPSPMVRAAAADSLGRSGDAGGLCLRLVQAPDTPEDILLAAHAQLVATPRREALSALRAALHPASPLSPHAREVLRATASVYPEELVAEGIVGGLNTDLVGVLPPPTAPDTPEPISAPPPGATARQEEIPFSSAGEPTSGGGVTLARSLEDNSHSSSETGGRRSPASARAQRRKLGRTGIEVGLLGLSGAGEVSPAALDAARAAGVNLFFWEPRYRALTELVSRSPRRNDLVIVAGSYEADARSIERDAERALRRLRVDALGAMLLFWVRSRARFDEGAYEALERLRRQGKVRAIGFSTHLRDLAEEAIGERSWDVVMCRLSAAHPGAERSLLPAAAARGVGVIAFSALCYGRLLADPSAGITAADCYRYALSQPGVSAVLSAPRRWRELAENLAVLERPLLPAGEIERLRAHGQRVHAANRAFVRLVHNM